MKKTLLFSLVILAANIAFASSLPLIGEIPRSMMGDKGRYYLLSAKKSGKVIQATTKRVGPDSVVFTKTEMNCRTSKMRVLGDSEESAEAILTNNPTKWFDIVSGSSKSDLAKHLCAREKEIK
jgi:hypothetical protein